MAFWDALSTQFETIWSQISCSGSEMGSKIDFRIINFVTWISGRPPGGPQGVPRGRPMGPSPLFRGRFWGHFWCPNLLISETIFALERSEVRERLFLDFCLVWEGQPCKKQWKTNGFWWFFIFALCGSRESFWHENVSRWPQNGIQNLSKMRSETRSENEVVLGSG